jgi:hypothetical protein
VETDYRSRSGGEGNKAPVNTPNARRKIEGNFRAEEHCGGTVVCRALYCGRGGGVVRNDGSEARVPFLHGGLVGVGHSAPRYQVCLFE